MAKVSGNKYKKASYVRGKAARLKRKLELKMAKKARMSQLGPKRENNNRKKDPNRYGSVWAKQVER